MERCVFFIAAGRDSRRDNHTWGLLCLIGQGHVVHYEGKTAAGFLFRVVDLAVCMYVLPGTDISGCKNPTIWLL